jgi:hypothetical protein
MYVEAVIFELASPADCRIHVRRINSDVEGGVVESADGERAFFGV